jgi:AraC family transcriptional regulator of adaptative response / DNA-3-methyladenine glycosylase II
MLKFLAERTVVEVEFVTGGTYSRIVRWGDHRSRIKASNTPENVLKVEFTHSLTPVLRALLGRMRHMFDLSERPDIIAAHLRQDAMLKKTVMQNPGLRVPSAFDDGLACGQQNLAAGFQKHGAERFEPPTKNRAASTRDSQL